MLHTGLLLVFLAGWVILKKINLKNILAVRYPLAVFCLALIICVMFSTNRLNSLKELYKYATGILLFIITASLVPEDKKRIAHSIIFAALFISLLAIYQYFFGFRHLTIYLIKNSIANAFAWDYISSKRVFYPFVTSNTLAGYLILIAPLALTIKDKKRRLILLPIILTLFLTKSLGAFLSLYVGLGFYLYLRNDLPKKSLPCLA